MPFGYMDTHYIDFPAGVDVDYINGLRTRAGVDFPRIIREIDSRLAALNTTLDPLVAALLAPPTTELYADGTGPVAFTIEKKSEYTTARPQLAEGQAHMLGISDWDVALGLTEDGLEAMSLNRILTNVDSLFLGYRRLYLLEALRRLFNDAEVRLDAKTTATSPGFAGSGTGDNVFSRPYPNGTALPGGYTHYYRDTTANRAVAIKAARDRLLMWNPGPFDLIGSQTAIDAVAALGDFVSAGSELIRVGSGTAEAQVDADIYIGVYDKNIRVRKPVTEISGDYAAVVKTRGAFAPENPLIWRYDEMRGRNAYIRYRSLYPLDQAMLLQKFGINVNNRTAAALIRFAASGAYSAPTIA